MRVVIKMASFITKNRLCIGLLFTVATLNSVNAQELKTQNSLQQVSSTKDLALEKQRLTYQNLQTFLQQPKIASLVPAEKLVAMLKEYPLYSYARYHLLSQQVNMVGLANGYQVADLVEKIKQFQHQFPTFSKVKINRLPQQLYSRLQTQQDWQNIIKLGHLLPAKTTLSQCTWLEAKLQSYAKLSPKQRQERLKQEKIWQKIEQLWLSGSTQPTSCDVVFQDWQKAKQLSLNLFWQRAALAFQQNNLTLFQHLVKLYNAKDSLVVISKKEEKQLKSTLNKLLPQLQLLLKKPETFPQFITKLSQQELDNTPQLKQLILAAYPRFLKALPESEVAKAQPLLNTTIAKKLGLSSAEQQLWLKQLVNRFFDNPQPTWQQWRDQKLLKLGNDSLIERRIREALRRQQPIDIWLNSLSNTAKQKDEWKYWQAEVLAQSQQQTDRQQAQQIWTGLATKRGFYPMLAAEKLAISYQPQYHEWNEKQFAEINLTPFHEGLARIQELIYFNSLDDAQQEWLRLLNKADFKQKLALSYYANQQEWYGLGVEATIQAKAWEHLRLRLPQAYLAWFNTHLKDRNISRSFAMAIARQESAWKTHVRSSANAYGLMQLLPTTAKSTADYFKLPYRADVKQLFDPATNIMLGTAHLEQLYQQYGNNRILIAAAYNAGRSRVDQWLERAGGKLSMAEFVATIPFYETRNYVQNVLAYDYYYQLLYQATAKKFSKSEYDRLY
ncbi:lytic murein transglycosylase [Mergibacter septicus]|uniref:Lytic murein transglycosylase n=2 Tax=Mergibacter septicus TaxID=221402 RepID=A0A8E3S8C1_9PAST|nr:lytic murein transglycosylase [Mergibacter septicus]QDJ14327.1 lytic murein transglycosylase [Mergibacter septicus]